MKIKFGCEFVYSCPQPTPMVLMLSTHPGEGKRLIVPDVITTDPAVPLTPYMDIYGNVCTRLVAPAGVSTISADGVAGDSGLPEPIDATAGEHAVEELPAECLLYLLGSRYCETQLLMNEAWRLFGHLAPGWTRVQAIADFVHHHIAFGYQHARASKTAFEAWSERQGVCRDFAHLSIALCRCMNIPARYCTGYLGDIGVPPTDAVMDFAGWTEVYLGGRWHTFDPRNRIRRIGRILVARGRDAADVALTTAFGLSFLQSFKVWTDELPPA